jgi:hypothetical protein
MKIMEQRNYDHIKGWGIDADPENDPTYPIKTHQYENQQDIEWPRPELQSTEQEILMSNERPYMTAVYGSPLPPSGLSGFLRRYAFRYSESNLMHWLSLLLADRINVIEGLIGDAKTGKAPNIFAERGTKAAWKYDRKNQVAKVVTFTLITTAVFVLRRSVKRRRAGK